MPLPNALPVVRPREIRLWWFCAQHWFDVWVTQESATSPVHVYFATPPHTLGGMVSDMSDAVAKGEAIAAPPPFGRNGRDMVLIGAQAHTALPMPPTVVPTSFGLIVIPNAPRWIDDQNTGAWSITLDGGGMP